MSKRTNSAPALRQIWGNPGEKNSNIIAPYARPPAASLAFTALSRIVGSSRLQGISRLSL
jgi:hypothetical protein